MSELVLLANVYEGWGHIWGSCGTFVDSTVWQTCVRSRLIPRDINISRSGGKCRIEDETRKCKMTCRCKEAEEDVVESKSGTG